MESQRIQQIMAEQHIPGLAIGVQQGETIVYEGYYGEANIEHHVPVHNHSLFEIASITKLFTAQAVLRLAQDGRIKLDDRLIGYLPDLSAAWAPVTIQHCLSHQSGIPNYTSIDRYWELTRNRKSHDEILALVRDLPMSFPPGTRHAYDNTGFYLLGMLIEAVSHKPYADVLRDLIFEPLGMADTQVNDNSHIILN